MAAMQGADQHIRSSISVSWRMVSPFLSINMSDYMLSVTAKLTETVHRPNVSIGDQLLNGQLNVLIAGRSWSTAGVLSIVPYCVSAQRLKKKKKCWDIPASRAGSFCSSSIRDSDLHLRHHRRRCRGEADTSHATTAYTWHYRSVDPD